MPVGLMLALGERQERALRHFFGGEQLEDARRLIVAECGENLPLHEHKTHPDELDRIRFATIKYSGGDLERLEIAIRLAQSDWRDLLVAVGFANDADEHDHWYQRGFAEKPFWKLW